MKVIVITESQYGRLFLSEQTAYERHLDRAYSTPEGARRQNQANREMVYALSKFWENHKHDIIDVAAIAVLFIPVAGPFISMGLELVNAGLYYTEGSEGMATFAALLAVVPGGMAIRRSMKASKILKGVDKATQSVIAAQKAGKEVSKEALEKKIKSEIGEKAFKKNQEVIVKYFDEVIPAMTRQSVQASSKALDELISKTSKFWLQFIESKQFTKLLAKNGDDMFKAYLAYLRRLAVLDGSIAGLLMGTLLYYEDEVADGINFTLTEVPGISDAVNWYMNKRLSDDADKGNIASIIKRDGFDFNQVKEIFMVTPYKENKEQNFDDNILLKKAWKSGWRPGETDWYGMYDIPEKFRTEKYKKYYEERMKEINGGEMNNLLKQSPETIERLSDSELTNFLDSALTSPATMSNPEMQDMVNRAHELIGDK